ncbi:hypothetical protein DUI87_28132 [Hirundo rustica rustica]|uniref:Endothelial cell-specific molecule 1 n=1 Tax=Hirundo rustica rustica TaxID=333673 RepID=A0A3M0J1V2_HIRRU|nr:hypothetical protein DUI87_28132 [Hirundo rustica rustica]
MKGFLFLTLLLMPVHAGAAWSAKYAVDCPDPCDSNACKSTARCKRTVLDDCGCCRVCAAALGETCYRTVSGMDGVKCGPGLKCQFYTEEDDFGDELVSAKPPNRRKISPHTDNDMASGDGNSVKEEFVKEKVIRSPVMKWLNPR